MLAAAALAATGCTSDSGDSRGFPPGLPDRQVPFTAYGRSLSVTVEDVQIKDQAYYKDLNGATYTVNPSQPGGKIVSVLLHVRNASGGKTLIDINEEAFSLRDLRDTEYTPINPFASPVLSPNVPNKEPVLDVMWGPNEFPQGFGIIAWTMFDLPPNTVPMEIRWAAVDIIFARFQPKPQASSPFFFTPTPAQ